MKRISIFMFAIITFAVSSFMITSSATARPYNPIVYEAQKALKGKNYDPDPLDGLCGKATSGAIKKFQLDSGLPVTGRLDEITKKKLGIKATSIPVDLTYDIIDASRVPGIKCSLDVRLNRKVSSEVLAELAIWVRNAEQMSYRRMFICYYLPGMTPGAGAWATSHFNPDLKVNILGLTAEEERKLVKKSDTNSNQIIGVWLDESPYMMGFKVTLRRENGNLVMVKAFKDESSGKYEMNEGRKNGLPKYEQKGENPHGEYYIIDHSGNLRVYDPLGLISTLRRVR